MAVYKQSVLSLITCCVLARFPPEKEQSRGRVSQRQIELVRDSWDLIQDVMEETSYYIYQSFMKTIENDLAVLFPRIIHYEGGEKVVVDEDMLKAHVMVIMEGLGGIVGILEDQDRVHVLIDHIAGVHTKNNVTVHMLERVWPAIDESFKSVLFDVYTHEVRGAWEVVINMIINLLTENIVK